MTAIKINRFNLNEIKEVSVCGLQKMRRKNDIQT
jgi:hypothetical protein